MKPAAVIIKPQALSQLPRIENTFPFLIMKSGTSNMPLHWFLIKRSKTGTIFEPQG